jgi:heme/copper-type cytochrome/quinol oxidase subunit 2
MTGRVGWGERMNTVYLAFFLIFLIFYLVLFLVLVFSHSFDQRRSRRGKNDGEYKEETIQLSPDVNPR